MDARHPDGQYSSGAKWFHWLTLPPIVILLLSGMTIRFISDEPKVSFYVLHESLGLLMLLLASARLAWRLTHPPPPMASHIPAFERFGAEATHHVLYLLLVAQPLLGFFTTNAYGFPQRGNRAFLGFIDLPAFMTANHDLAVTLHWAHSICGWLLVPLIGAHIAGVLMHHVVKDDATLMRML